MGKFSDHDFKSEQALDRVDFNDPIDEHLNSKDVYSM